VTGTDDALTTTSIAVNNGTFVDGIVEGLVYSTSSGLSGKTDASGNFKYTDGDMISFSIGNVVVGAVSSAALADGAVFLQEVAGVGLEDMNNDYVENMAVLLQSLDNDGDAYNGIVIEQSVHQALSDDNFDMATISKANLQSLLIDNGYQPIDEDAAMQHVRDMIAAETGRTEFDERLSAIDSRVTEEEDIFALPVAEAEEAALNNATEEVNDAPNLMGAEEDAIFAVPTAEEAALDSAAEAANDALDLSDLLPDETQTLDNYLGTEEKDPDTEVDSNQDTGEAASDQASALQGENILNGQQIVDDLLNKNNSSID
jgi:hypothetical protein